MTTTHLSGERHELEEFFDAAPVGLHIVGPDGRVRWANWADLAGLGYEPDEYLGGDIAHFHAERSTIEEMLENLLADRPLVNFHARLRAKDGSELPVVIYSNSRMDRSRFVNTRCLTRTQRIDAAAPPDGAELASCAPSDVEQRIERLIALEDFFDHAILPLAIVGDGGTIRRASVALARAVGYGDRREALRGIVLADVFADPAADVVSALAAGDRVSGAEVVLSSGVGQRRTYLLFANATARDGTFFGRCVFYPADDPPTSPRPRFDWPGSAAEQARS
jgi:PAS domain S-box-containing protein